MKWLDLFGLPGVGKSTICDPIPMPALERSVAALPPPGWRAFMDCVKELLPLTDWHPSAHIARRAIKTAIHVTAIVNASEGPPIIHRCFAHRGLSIGCRMKDPENVRPFYRLMPLSLGVAFFTTDIETIRKRFNERDQVSKVTPDQMLPALNIAVDELSRRTPLLVIDTAKPIEQSRARLMERVRIGGS